MQKSIISTLAVLVGSILFNVLFWREKQGLNTLIFDLFIIAVLFGLNKEAFSAPSVKITVGGTLLAVSLIIWHNSLLVKYIHVFSFATMVGLVQQRELRFLGYAFIQYFLNWFEAPIQFFTELKNLPILRGQVNIGKRLNGSWLTLLIFPVFYLIYFLANAKFAELSSRFWGRVFSFFSFDINLEHILFFLFGIILVGAAIWQQRWVDFSEKDKSYSDTLVEPETIEEDESTYRNALNLVIALNLLLLINNVIDVRYVWFGDVSGKTALELKQYVHEGTYLLIFGIVLAISIILWLFKGGLNFEENTNKTPSILRGVTALWLAQNAVLALSVGIRNAQYILHYGLAYKRIGVCVFLVLTLYGLWLLYLKIKEKRTLFFFIRRGAFALYLVLLATCLVNWDGFITSFNIKVPVKSGAVDVRFLVEDVSDKNLYLLFQNVEKLAPKMAGVSFPEGSYSYRDSAPISDNNADRLAHLKVLLNNKKLRFENEQKSYSWFSWNHADAVNKEFLATQK
jgi:Domain of unknown function (DUF4173)